LIAVLASTCPNLQNLALSGITDFILSEEGQSQQALALSSYDRSQDGACDEESNASNSAAPSTNLTNASLRAFPSTADGKFEHLKALEVWSSPGHPGPSKHILKALSAAAKKLQHFLIQGCVQFDDEFLDALLSVSVLPLLLDYGFRTKEKELISNSGSSFCQ
jgi:hypothetical protein